ncbi:DNA-binding transcriptional regulator, MarR family [Rhizobium sp. NFR07]|uniref:MarR family winged helix-turn-helix transcriptional regulator n=1 Tax=Rhizobium sp. NFR07 TaxID=1566262 RepID=UPI0008F3D480|nr:MarR family transcriptional regulator [Rhizobium sp. NFR07]SFA93578.1 DNA-binding transcriptional regulator, MarR family [Rhizobium sp. NFR07]
MVEDVVKSFGYLTLGTRLRRIGERLQADTQQIIEEAGLSIQTAHFPVMAAMDRLGPLTIGDLAQAVGISQPGITRSVSQLVQLGYVDLKPTAEDQRRKLASLTAAGQEFIDHSKRAVWPRIAQAVAEVCDGLSGPLLDQLAAIEAALAEVPLVRRGSKTEPSSGREEPAIRKQTS